MPKTVKELLLAALALIRNKGWNQHGYARDAEGLPCHPASDSAVCFCALGALCNVLDVDPLGARGTSPMYGRATRFLAEAIPGHWSPPNEIHGKAVVQWQDAEERTQDEVEAIFETASHIAAGCGE